VFKFYRFEGAPNYWFARGADMSRAGPVNRMNKACQFQKRGDLFGEEGDVIQSKK